MNFPILSTLIFLPIVSAFLLFFFRSKNNSIVFGLGFLISLINFFVSIVMLMEFDISKTEYQFIETLRMFSVSDIKYFVGIDGISLVMILLTTLLIPICIAISYKTIKSRVKEFIIAFLILEGLVIGSFCSLDLLFFYIFFEAMLIPMFLIIGIWGGENRVYASYKFFLYTLFGSVFFLISIITIFLYTGTTDVVSLSKSLKNFC